nr:MAG TPA: hypothetical protein [Caudoviricetes sp.]
MRGFYTTRLVSTTPLPPLRSRNADPRCPAHRL